MEVHFKFEIGQLVIPAHWRDEIQIGRQFTALQPEGISAALPVAYKVTERLFQECSGGRQHFYSCAPALGRHGANVRFHDIELEAFNIKEYLRESFPGRVQDKETEKHSI